MEELTQHEKILVIMFKHYKQTGQAAWFRASFFQHEHYGIFVGYEATARMSELFKKYPFMFNTRQNERFRELQFKFDEANQIHRMLPHELGKHMVREQVMQPTDFKPATAQQGQLFKVNRTVY